MTIDINIYEVLKILVLRDFNSQQIWKHKTNSYIFQKESASKLYCKISLLEIRYLDNLLISCDLL